MCYLPSTLVYRPNHSLEYQSHISDCFLDLSSFMLVRISSSTFFKTYLDPFPPSHHFIHIHTLLLQTYFCPQSSPFQWRVYRSFRWLKSKPYESYLILSTSSSMIWPSDLHANQHRVFSNFLISNSLLNGFLAFDLTLYTKSKVIYFNVTQITLLLC